jgi:hypothetical protein
MESTLTALTDHLWSLQLRWKTSLGIFLSKLGVASMGPYLGELLCSALSPKPKKSSSDAELYAKAGNMIDTALCFMPEKRSLDDSNEINMYGPEQIPSTAVVYKGLPMLIIDNFNEATDKNKAFVKTLFQEASQFGVFVFILTSNETWATTLVGLNGGSIDPRSSRSMETSTTPTTKLLDILEKFRIGIPCLGQRRLSESLFALCATNMASILLQWFRMVPK